MARSENLYTRDVGNGVVEYYDDDGNYLGASDSGQYDVAPVYADDNPYLGGGGQAPPTGNPYLGENPVPGIAGTGVGYAAPTPMPSPAPRMQGSYGGYGGTVPQYGSMPSPRVMPTYQDGSSHPAFGGMPRTAGGGYGQTSGGYGNAPAHSVYLQTRPPRSRTYHENVGTLTAGGSYPGMPGPKYGGRSTRGSGGSGGGGGSDLYYAWRSKLMSKLYPGSGSGYSSYGGSSYGGSSYKPDKEQKPIMTGYAKGMKLDNAEALYARPSMMIPRVAPGVEMTSPYYDRMEELPAYELAMLGSARQKSTDRTAFNQYANALGRTYYGAAKTGNLPELGTMLNQVTNARPKSNLGQLFRPQPPDEEYVSGYTKKGKPKMKTADPYYEEPPLLTAADTIGQVMGAIGYTSGMDPRTQAALNTYVSRLTDQFGSRNLTRDPTKMGRINRYVGNRVARQF